MCKKSAKDLHTDALLNNFAIRSFRDTADGDYISARLCYRNKLVQQFLWSSLQAIEKYLKCILLLNRVVAKNVNHDLSKALRKIEKHAPFTMSLSDDTRAFLEYLDTYGRFRYLETPYEIHRPELVRLDKTVWEIRRYCQVIDYKIRDTKGKPVDMLPFKLEEIKRSERPILPHQFKLSNGRLEKINMNKNHPARAALIWQNGFFGKKSRRVVQFSVHSEGVNSPLSLHPDMLEEVRKYVHLPKDVIVAYQERQTP